MNKYIYVTLKDSVFADRMYISKGDLITGDMIQEVIPAHKYYLHRLVLWVSNKMERLRVWSRS